MSDNSNNKKGGKIKEFFRKRIVSLKRNTQIIPLLFLIVGCCIFTFALGTHSIAANDNYTVAMENAFVAAGGSPVSLSHRSVGLYVFIITLFSVLSVISYLSVYKKGKRTRSRRSHLSVRSNEDYELDLCSEN